MLRQENRPARTLLAITAALMAYASFYPFDADWNRLAHARRSPLSALLPWRQTGEGDMIVNLVGYIPLGLLLALSMPARWTPIGCLLRASAAGGLFSLCVELAQHATRTRNPNLIDVVLNSIGAAVGGLLAIWFRRYAAGAGITRGAVQPVHWILLLLWTSLHAAPFIPSIGWYKLNVALEPLRGLAWTATATARAFASWIVLAEVLRAIARPGRFAMIFAAAAAASLLLRVTMLRQHLAFDELIALVLASPVIALAGGKAFRRAGLAFLAVVAAIAVNGLAPFHFDANAHGFGWMPFGGFLEMSRDQSYLVAIEKALLYMGAVWLGVESGWTVARSAAGVAMLLGAIEFAQMWQPGRSAEIADPLMALLAGAVVWIAGARR